ncbi:ABC transporter permease [Saccharicrinis aurantiacus]|uniref:ABC transporter permease n=1 Tax=Saccharicrinis aurantiacus TaxID=1849719 RepID=UPI002493025F|nr:ABC transporter permease [Saccharicrinis aurantiacus]
MIAKIKQSLRSVISMKHHAIISIIGLTIGISCCSLATTWAYVHWSFDKHIDEVDDIYMLAFSDTIDNDLDIVVPTVAAEYMRNNFSELENTALLNVWPESFSVNINKHWHQLDICNADYQFLEILPFHFIQKTENPLQNKGGIIISEKEANRLFGSTSVLGESIILKDSILLTIEGIYKDFPENTTFKQQAFVNFETSQFYTNNCEGWFNWCDYIITKVNTNNVTELEERLNASLNKAVDKLDVKVSLYPYSKLHLETPFEVSKTTHIIVISLAGLIVLLISIINYFSLLTNLFYKGQNKFKLKRILGAKHRQIIIDYWLDISIVVIISSLCALIISIFCIPFFIEKMNVNFFNTIGYGKLLLIVSICTITTIIICACYQYLLYAFAKKSPYNKKQNFGKTFNTTMVIAQFAIAVFIALSAYIMQKQISFAIHSDKGYSIKNLIQISTYNYPIGQNVDVISAKLNQNPNILSYSFNQGSFQEFSSSIESYSIEGKENEYRYIFRTSSNLFKTTGIKILKGRAFNPTQFNEEYSLIINAKYALDLGGYDKALTTPLIHNDKKYTVIGICDNFNIANIYTPIRQLVITYSEPSNYCGCLLIKTNGNNAVAIKDINKILSDISPQSYILQTMQEASANLYVNEQAEANILGGFGLLTLLISSIGLLSMTIFIVEQKTKEIGIRKVNGANIAELMKMLNINFITKVSIAFAVACPVVVIVMHIWLQEFAYRITVNWLVYIFAFIILMSLSLISVSTITYRAAKQNPIKALRYE